IERCAQDGVAVTWLSRTGRFAASLRGPTRGNVLLRRAQHLRLDDGTATQDIARQVVAAKIRNSRHVLLRAARDAGGDLDSADALSSAADRLASRLAELRHTEGIDTIR